MIRYILGLMNAYLVLSEKRPLIYIILFVPIWFVLGLLMVVPFGVAFQLGGRTAALLTSFLILPVIVSSLFVTTALFRIPFKIIGIDIFPLKQIYRTSIRLTQGPTENG